MSTAANTATSKRVTLHDVAAKAGVSYNTVSKCITKKDSAYSKDTVAKVRKAASELGYKPRRLGENKFAPTNSIVFKTREEETAAMLQCRNSGMSNEEVARRCGVDYQIVLNRIGNQPAEITSANKKLAGRVRSAKVKIKKAYVQQQTVAQYNELAAKLNAQLEEAKKMATELSAMQKKAKVASKATGTPLLRLLPPTKVS